MTVKFGTPKTLKIWFSQFLLCLGISRISSWRNGPIRLYFARLRFPKFEKRSKGAFFKTNQKRQETNVYNVLCFWKFRKFQIGEMAPYADISPTWNAPNLKRDQKLHFSKEAENPRKQIFTSSVILENFKMSIWRNGPIRLYFADLKFSKFVEMS